MKIEPKEIAVYLLLLNVLFHYFSYSFTIFGADYSDYNIALGIEDLYMSGIMIGEYDEHNVSWTVPMSFTTFTIVNSTMRVSWTKWGILNNNYHGLGWMKRSPFFGFDMWIDFKWQDIGPSGHIIRNSTIVDNWDRDHNWTKIHNLLGFVLFITDPLKEGNITRAVYEDGIVTCTLCEDLGWYEEPSIARFISWYTGLVTGSESWGLPEEFSIIVQIMTLLGIFSAVFLLSDLRRIVK